VINQLLDESITLPETIDREQLIVDVLDESIGLGPLERLLEDSSISEIMVNAPDEIWVERAGRLQRHASAFTDDAAVRSVLASMLRTMAVEAIEVAGGPSALAATQAVAANRPLLAFVDLAMPDVDGREVVRQLRTLRPDARVVLMSGHADAQVDEAALAIVPDRVLGKPFHAEKVRTLVRELLAPRD
jgi:CheY-like chemotaxis protein